MKTFKRLYLTFALTCGALGTVFLTTGCKKDPCKDVTCQNGGTCDDGTCKCTAGYEGSDCSTETRSKFIATYNYTSTCTESGNSNGNLVVSTSSTGVSNIILNLDGGQPTVSASVNGSSLTIPSQNVNMDGFGATVSGSGQLNGNQLTLSMTFVISTVAETCTLICTKQ